ncbi:MAG: prepilin-type N-terminal cleavage/methylation domain-containing protein [Phycisphaerales bacterium]|nr:prepilin-type N-terminal cleavage/methylation domain-containing protein [Phycisphaerales bacterium]
MTQPDAQSCSTRHHRSAFSLIELVIVVVIIGIIGAIAIPRMSSASENAAANAVIADRSTLQRAIDLYEVEHEGVMIHVGAGNIKTYYFRLLKKSDLDGTVDDDGIYGPYINTIPTNLHNGKPTIRIDGVAAGANTDGWRYDSVSGLIEPDHTAGLRTFTISGDAIDKTTGDIINKGD